MGGGHHSKQPQSVLVNWIITAGVSHHHDYRGVKWQVSLYMKHMHENFLHCNVMHMDLFIWHLDSRENVTFPQYFMIWWYMWYKIGKEDYLGGISDLMFSVQLSRDYIINTCKHLFHEVHKYDIFRHEPFDSFGKNILAPKI